MIVRKVLDKPMMKFDFFNDFMDTWAWLQNPSLPRHAKMVARILQMRYKKLQEQKGKKWLFESDAVMNFKNNLFLQDV